MKRYIQTACPSGNHLHEEPNGEWVRYEDALAEIMRLRELHGKAVIERDDARGEQRYWEKLVDKIGCAHVKDFRPTLSKDLVVITECVDASLIKSVKDPREFIEHIVRVAAEKLYKEIYK